VSNIPLPGFLSLSQAIARVCAFWFPDELAAATLTAEEVKTWAELSLKVPEVDDRLAPIVAKLSRGKHLRRVAWEELRGLLVVGRITGYGLTQAHGVQPAPAGTWNVADPPEFVDLPPLRAGYQYNPISRLIERAEIPDRRATTRDRARPLINAADLSSALSQQGPWGVEAKALYRSKLNNEPARTEAVVPKSGAPGRPSSAHLVVDEFKRRVADSQVSPSMKLGTSRNLPVCAAGVIQSPL
jgi:hypothetical protein